MRKLLLFLLPAIALLWSSTTQAQEFTLDGLQYIVNDNGTNVTLKGLEQNSGITELIIPATVNFGDNTYTVTAIAEKALSDNKEITSVTMPNTITEVGKSAFSYCRGLLKVVCSDAILELKPYVFQYCQNLADIKLPADLQILGEGVFMVAHKYQK